MRAIRDAFNSQPNGTALHASSTRLEAMFITSVLPAASTVQEAPTVQENALDFLSGAGSDLRIRSHE